MNETQRISKPDRTRDAKGDHARSSDTAADHAPLLSPLRELQLVEAYRKGDPEALGTLLRSYQRRIYSICHRMVRNDDVARDLTQESMVRVLEGLDGFDARARLSTWVIRITMNCCISHLRKRKVRGNLSLDAPTAARGLESDAAEGPGVSARDILEEDRELTGPARVEQDEMRAILLRGLDHLDPHLRAVLVLRDMQDLGYQQIAEIIDKPLGTVKSRLWRARAALREEVERIIEQGGTARSRGKE